MSGTDEPSNEDDSIKRCGRLDKHPPHSWLGITERWQRGYGLRRVWTCPGEVLIEGALSKT